MQTTFRSNNQFDEKDHDIISSNALKNSDDLFKQGQPTILKQHALTGEKTLFSPQNDQDPSSPSCDDKSSETNDVLSFAPLTVSVDRNYEPYEYKISTKNNAITEEHSDISLNTVHKEQQIQENSPKQLPSHPRTFTPINISSQPGPLSKTDRISDENKFKPRSSNYVHDIQQLLQRIVNKNQYQPSKSYHMKKLDRNQLVQDLIKNKKLRVPKVVEVKKYNHKYGDIGSTKLKRMGTGKFNYGSYQDDIREAFDYIEGEKELARIQEEQRYLIAQKRIPRATVTKKRRGSSAASAIYGLEHQTQSKSLSTPSRKKNVSFTSPVLIGRINSDHNNSTGHTTHGPKNIVANVNQPEAIPSSLDSPWVHVVKQSHGNLKDDEADLTGEPINDQSVSPLDNMSSALTQVTSKISSEIMNWFSPQQAHDNNQ